MAGAGLLPWHRGVLAVFVPHAVAMAESLLAQKSVRSVQEWQDSLADETAALRDVSSDVCWQAGFTKEKCCRGDASTAPECWDGSYSFGECCPNADCWEGEFSYDFCCGAKYGPGGNTACWAGSFTHQLCCLANATSNSWADVLASQVETEQFYKMDDFYTDAQYGDEWGYYSKGHVLLGGGKAGQGDAQGTQQFAHFTTYPMALSPHFARVFCRLLFVMWVQLNERAPFRVVEMGAGSGQLAYDTQQCVRTNALGLAPSVWRRWTAAFEYTIMERSPALRKRQQSRGLRSVSGDAQSTASCKSVLAALAASTACQGAEGLDAPECEARDRGTAEAGASVVLSNELLDAFAPVKLRFGLYGKPNITDCGSWQEVRVVHTIPEDRLHQLLMVMGFSEAWTEGTIQQVRSYTESTFCAMANTSIGREAQEKVAVNTSCLAIAFSLSELVNHLDLGIPFASHNMRMRIRKDSKLSDRLRTVTSRLDSELRSSVALPRDIYRQVRHQLRDLPDVEAEFLHATQTHLLPVSLSQERCDELAWWFDAHEPRIARLALFYRKLGYPAVHVVVRPGEDNFIDLVDCLLGPTGGYKLSLDYGANFEGLVHSLSVDGDNDGIFVPPIPHELMAGLPECHNFWPKCAGRIDWTTFVDFTNLAAAGERRGWRTLFYGPQNLLEQFSRLNLTLHGKSYSVPGYAVLQDDWISRHIKGWYGRESDMDGTGVQRWTSFKALLLEKPSAKQVPTPILFPSWHLDTRLVDPCWSFDPSTVPLADWIPRQGNDPHEALLKLTDEINSGLGRQYAEGYEEAQLGVRLVDFIVAKSGCDTLRPENAAAVLERPSNWQALRRRLLRKWGEMWGEETVSRVALDLFRRLADDGPHLPASPFACAGQQAMMLLCDSPGGGSKTGPLR
ncbi:unnamed protein product [Symbiodinium necroappetens]|uniref:type II protein arginine methyltransferase n=2 Tax=Symbiodinium TaxID=2949 RepID=A0A812JSN5_9DINO|nr:hypothetical protein AK812_SmicGene30526 [Symbiodinium microadriaticum]CAE7208159.1 unnamed protein product [Symbiodinium necroappetens]CAE7806767.1 unnamed protein product [Symbiodinium sp. KB8]CAE7843828.1 unnamed protein product [Symbiodinium microadriaticum]